MNIIIHNIFIFLILIRLNSAVIKVHITIDKSELKSEPKMFYHKKSPFGAKGQFHVRMAQWSNANWEYSQILKTTDANGNALLMVTKEEENNIINKNEEDSLILAVKVEMVDNKSVTNIYAIQFFYI